MVGVGAAEVGNSLSQLLPESDLLQAYAAAGGIVFIGYDSYLLLQTKVRLGVESELITTSGSAVALRLNQLPI